MKSSNFIKNIKNNIKNVNGIIIIKLLLCLYILFSVNIQNKLILKILDDNGIKILLLILIIYLITVDYTLSLLISICLIISIIIHNKDNIELLKKKNKLLRRTNEKKEETDETDSGIIQNNNTEDENEDENKEINSASISLDNVDGFINPDLKSIQNNTFNSINNKLYMSADYDTPIITTQGELN